MSDLTLTRLLYASIVCALTLTAALTRLRKTIRIALSVSDFLERITVAVILCMNGLHITNAHFLLTNQKLKLKY